MWVWIEINFVFLIQEKNTIELIFFPEHTLSCLHFGRPCLVAKFKTPKLSHRKKILYAWSIKSRRNKKRIA